MTSTSQYNSDSVQFRILTGSYEHNMLCVSLILPSDKAKTPVFQPIFHLESHSLSIYCVSASKRYLVSGSKDEHIKIYDLQKRKELGDLLSHEGSINTLRFSNNGKWLLSGSNDKSIIIWRVKDWEIFGKLKGHKEAVTDLAIHPSNKIAISCSADNTLRLWNLMTVKKAAVLRLKYENTKAQKPQFIRWSISGDYFLVALLNKVLIYSTNTCKVVKILELKSTIMHSELYKIQDTEYLVIGLNNAFMEFYKFEELVKVSVSDSGSETESNEEETAPKFDEPAFKLIGHTNRIKDFKIYRPEQSNTDYLVSISSDGKIVVWNIDTKEQIAVYDAGERLNCVEIVPESVEKADSMKKRTLEDDQGYKTESEYETDGEGTKKMLFGNDTSQKKRKKNKNKAKNKKKADVQVE